MITCEQMKELERTANDRGLSYSQMMENAGACAVREIEKEAPALTKSKPILILCGKGNNGGDGLVAARYLAEKGNDVTVLLVEGPPRTPDAIKNFDLLAPLSSVTVTAKTPSDMQPFSLIIDALYGTGFHGRLRSEAARLTSDVNRAHMNGTFVAALDIPSGLPGNLGPDDPIGPCIQADLTIAFHDKKPIHEHHRGSVVMGKIVVADIGITECLA